jgi:hypothetical protein
VINKSFRENKMETDINEVWEKIYKDLGLPYQPSEGEEEYTLDEFFSDPSGSGKAFFDGDWLD